MARAKGLNSPPLSRPGGADHFDSGFPSRVTFVGGLQRPAVRLLQCVSVRGSVFLGELHATDSHFQQPRGRLVIRTATQRFFRFRHPLPDFGRFNCLGRTVRVGGWRWGLGRSCRLGRRDFRSRRLHGRVLPAATDKQDKTEEHSHAPPPGFAAESKTCHCATRDCTRHRSGRRDWDWRARYSSRPGPGRTSA